MVQADPACCHMLPSLLTSYTRFVEQLAGLGLVGKPEREMGTPYAPGEVCWVSQPTFKGSSTYLDSNLGDDHWQTQTTVNRSRHGTAGPCSVTDEPSLSWSRAMDAAVTSAIKPGLLIAHLMHWR